MKNIKKNKIAEVKIDEGLPTLYVDGQPFQAFAGEVHNSAAYDPDRMETEIWRKKEQSHLNTLIVPVYWETLEPEEGRYDFVLVDALLEQAVRYKKKLILLWFGLWKNAELAYVPAWMKQMVPELINNPMIEHAKKMTLAEGIFTSPEIRPVYEAVINALNKQDC